MTDHVLAANDPAYKRATVYLAHCRYEWIGEPYGYVQTAYAMAENNDQLLRDLTPAEADAWIAQCVDQIARDERFAIYAEGQQSSDIAAWWTQHLSANRAAVNRVCAVLGRPAVYPSEARDA